MKRGKRWLFNFVAAISLAVLVLVALGMYRSRTYEDAFTFSSYGKLIVLRLDSQLANVAVVHGWPHDERLDHESLRLGSRPSLPAGPRLQPVRGVGVFVHEFLGFSYWGLSNVWVARRASTNVRFDLASPMYRVTGFSAAWPTLMVLSAAIPLLWLGAMLYSWGRVATRHRNGLCLACGYDLRATPGQCPECGAIPASETASAK